MKEGGSILTMSDYAFKFITVNAYDIFVFRHFGMIENAERKKTTNDANE